jgi:predicted nucleic acid-binding protein
MMAMERALRGETVHVPAIFDAEAYAVVRRELRRGRLSEPEGLGALFHIRRLTAARHAVSPMLLEAFSVRDRFGAHDVFYAVLARRLGATLVTTDGPLGRACAGYVPVRLLSS